MSSSQENNDFYERYKNKIKKHLNEEDSDEAPPKKFHAIPVTERFMSTSPKHQFMSRNPSISKPGGGFKLLDSLPAIQQPKSSLFLKGKDFVAVKKIPLRKTSLSKKMSYVLPEKTTSGITE